jgi:hypothetical protein
VFFRNTGTAEWRRNSATQVNLAICLEDKTTCNVASPNSAWNDGSWLSNIAYSSTTNAWVVRPGEFGAFAYNVKAPVTISSGIWRFHGDLVVAGTLEKIHPQGYYHEVVCLCP